MNNKCISKSLLDAVVIRPEPHCFNIGMDEWIEPHLLTVSAQTSSSSSTPLSATPSSAPLRLSSPLAISGLGPAQLPKKRSSSTPLDSAVEICTVPLPKKLKLEEKPITSRFHRATEEELELLSKQSIPQKTEDATKWAIHNFHAWVESRKNSEAHHQTNC